MGLRIQNNIEAFNTHRQLTATATQASKSMEKLSSGYRINRAADDAAGLGISEKMRGQIGGLAQAQQNAQDGISAVQTAEGALSEVHSMLQRVRDLKVQFNNGTLDDNDKTSISSEVARDRQGSQQHRRQHRVQRQVGLQERLLVPGRRQRQRDHLVRGDGPQRRHLHRRPVELLVDLRHGHRFGGARRHRRRPQRPRQDRRADRERLQGPRSATARCRTASSTV